MLRAVTSERESAWSELVGRPAELPPRVQNWLLYAFDPSERPAVGLREREWQVEAPTEEYVVRLMAKRLRAISVGRVPK